ncbi:MAG: TlpA disulfide reductase family protein [Planctomycetota bacterium]|nr:TlpA disulfide reductase family protein [Planctomycetota bacterium]
MGGSLPQLAEFYDKNKSDRFEILAFHDNSVRSLAELDEKLKSVKKRFWKGRDLPFPVLFDATDTTLTRYRIRAFPTMILIDPKGRLVGETHLDGLKAALAGKLKMTEQG